MALSGEPVWLSQELVDKYACERGGGSAASTAGTPREASSRRSSLVEEESARCPQQDANPARRKFKDVWRSAPMVEAAGVVVGGEDCHRCGEEKLIEALPSEGSRLHSKGQCKPCAFFHTQGCQSGAQCKFCHLCPPREVQRRKQIRRRIQREMLSRTADAQQKGALMYGGGAEAAFGAFAQAQMRHPLLGAMGAMPLAPFAPFATPMLMNLGSGMPGAYFQPDGQSL